MSDNVRLNYSKYPERLESGIVKISEDRDIKLSLNEDSNCISLEIRDYLFGTKNTISVDLDFEKSKDFYRLMYILIKQIDN